jgi:hypothetical protein
MRSAATRALLRYALCRGAAERDDTWTTCVEAPLDPEAIRGCAEGTEGICGTIACLPANSVAIRGEAARNQVAEVQLRGRCTGCARV